MVVPAAPPDHDGSISHHRPHRVGAGVANEPKSLAILRNAGHNDLFEQGAWPKVAEFLATFEEEEVRPAVVVRPRFEPVALAS